MDLLRSAALLGCAMLLLPATSSAALLVATGAPEVSFNLFSDGATFSNPDVRGTALLTDLSTGESALLTDANNPSSPNTALLGFATGELLFVAFNFAGTTIDPSLTIATIPGIGTPLTATTNSVLASLVGENDYRFRLNRITDIGGGVAVVTFVLFEAGEIPEPGSMQLMGTAALGIAAFGLIKRRRRA